MQRHTTTTTVTTSAGRLTGQTARPLAAYDDSDVLCCPLEDLWTSVTTVQPPYQQDEGEMLGSWTPWRLDDDNLAVTSDVVDALTMGCLPVDSDDPGQDFDPLNSSWPELWSDTNILVQEQLCATLGSFPAQKTSSEPSSFTCSSDPRANILKAAPPATVIVDLDELDSILGYGGEATDLQSMSGAGDEMSGSEEGIVTLDADNLNSILDAAELKFENASAAGTSSWENENSEISSDEDESDGDSDASWGPTTAKRRRVPAPRPAKQQKPRRGPRSRRVRGPPVSQDQRKKEQNKTAATKYRERKRVEEIENEIECEKLEKRNAELRGQLQDMTHEISVLRALIVDIFRGHPANI